MNFEINHYYIFKFIHLYVLILLIPLQIISQKANGSNVKTVSQNKHYNNHTSTLERFETENSPLSFMISEKVKNDYESVNAR